MHKFTGMKLSLDSVFAEPELLLIKEQSGECKLSYEHWLKCEFKLDKVEQKHISKYIITMTECHKTTRTIYTLTCSQD